MSEGVRELVSEGVSECQSVDSLNSAPVVQGGCARRKHLTL